MTAESAPATASQFHIDMRVSMVRILVLRSNIILERTEFALCKFTFASSFSAPPHLLTSLPFYLSRGLQREPLRLLVTAI